MERHTAPGQTRRELLRASCAIPVALGLVASGRRRVMAQGKALPPTPACTAQDNGTPSQTAGPFYKRSSPQRTSLLEQSITGTKIVVTGTVLSTDCQPIAQALLDFWQADARGAYDNTGYRLRGHQFTDATGHYTLETIVPGGYPGRTRHIHVKVQAPNQPVLTTQLYFPGESHNATDMLFRPELLLTVQDVSDGKAATFNFVLESQPKRTQGHSRQG
jgi:protocatechuate 3,4-dioxygenase beta subunit